MITEKELKYVRLTKFLADEFSRDTSTKVGTIIIHPETYEILVTGYNGFPRKVDERLDRKERPIKYAFTEHSERNALYSAARRGISVNGAILISTMFPCSDCARGIIQSGISRIISPPIDNERWVESSKYAEEMLQEAGITIDLIKKEE